MNLYAYRLCYVPDIHKTCYDLTFKVCSAIIAHHTLQPVHSPTRPKLLLHLNHCGGYYCVLTRK
jgi:hypothetical protein